MPRIYTLSDISEGNKLGGIPSSRYPPNRIELENQLAYKDNKRIQRDLKQSNKDKEELSKHIYQLIDEVKRLSSELDSLISQITCKDISLNKSKIKIKDLQSRIKILETELSSTRNESKKIESLESVIDILKSKLSSAQKDVISIQNDSLKKEFEILSLKSKIAEVEHELASKVSELDCLKSEGISKPVLGGDDEKNTQSEEQSSITKSDNISLGSTDLSKYFVRRKNMDQAGKIDTIIPDYTDDESTPIPKSPRVNTEIIPKVSDETNISETNKPIMFQIQEIKNVTPYLAQPENYIPSLIKPHPQISVGGIEAIRPSLEALPLSAGASTLMSPLSAYICLILFIITVMWFVRRTWGFDRKNEQLRDMWARY
ncbi:11254_t:CDS:2 [Entrophospora sp. SA101]|nr:11254_t:CDS:2 [Entrophospora sp. SA101]